MKYKLLFGLLLASASLNVRADETSNLRLLEFMARHPQATKACAAVIAGSAAGGAVGAAVGGTCGAGILSGLFSGVKNGCIFSGLSATFNYLCDDQNQPSQPPELVMMSRGDGRGQGPRQRATVDRDASDSDSSTGSNRL